MRTKTTIAGLIGLFTTVLVGTLVLALAGCAPVSTPAPADIPSASVAREPLLIPASTPTSALPARLPTPTATPIIHTYGPPPFSFAPVPLEQRIYFAPTIVRAALLSGEPSIETVVGNPGVAPTYKAVHRYQFNVIEYLRGGGPEEITVRYRSNDAYLTEEEAWGIAKRSFEFRNASWDDREAVLFLIGQNQSGVSGASGQQPQTFQFPTWAWGEFQYTVDTLNRVWLPSAQASGAAGQSADEEARSYLTGNSAGDAGGVTGSGETSSRISLAELRSKITAASADLLAGREIEGYEECLDRKFAYEQDRHAEAIRGESSQQYEVREEIESGAAWWTEVDRLRFASYEVAGKEYNRIWLEGADKALFFAEIDDDDKDYRNGFSELVATARPLPAGVYRAEIHGQHALYIPCNFVPGDAHDPLVVTVTAPPGTPHEAFFDPIAIGSAIGADGTNGVLKPTEFTANGTATAIQSLKWDPTGIVTLTLSSNASLDGLALDFIALEGTVALTLPVSSAKTDGAAGTLRWSMLNSPWRAGDQLMLRIRNADPGPTAPPTPTPTPTPTATATSTPTAIPTSTPTPTTLPDAPPGPVSGQ